jgi:IS5 family transposase
LAREAAPDATTLLKFRRLLERHDLRRKIFEVIEAHLAQKGLMMRKGTLVDVTLIAAPPSTKNWAKACDPEMLQTKKRSKRNALPAKRLGCSLRRSLLALHPLGAS